MQNLSGAPLEILDQLVKTYNKSVMPLILVLLLICIAATWHDQKVGPIFRKGMRYFVTASVMINCLSLFVNTVMWMIGSVGGNTTLP